MTHLVLKLLPAGHFANHQVTNITQLHDHCDHTKHLKICLKHWTTTDCTLQISFKSCFLGEPSFLKAFSPLVGQSVPYSFTCNLKINLKIQCLICLIYVLFSAGLSDKLRVNPHKAESKKKATPQTVLQKSYFPIEILGRRKRDIILQFGRPLSNGPSSSLISI